MKSQANGMALAGMMTALAVVILCLGSLIPVNTYVCPVVCIMLNRLVLERCGKKLGWCYYMAVAILGLLLAPDREAALVYLCLGYYPMIRGGFERLPGKMLQNLTKVIFFTLAGACAYGLLALVMGMEAVLGEYTGTGMWLLVLTVVVWNLLFLVVDKLLGRPWQRRIS